MKDYRRTQYVLGTTLLVELMATFILAIVILLLGDVAIKNPATHVIAALILLFVMIESMTVTIMKYNYSCGPAYKENLKRFNAGKKAKVEPTENFQKNMRSDMMRFYCKNASFYAFKKEHGEVGILIVYYPKNKKDVIYKNIKLKKRYFYKYFAFSNEVGEMCG